MRYEDVTGLLSETGLPADRLASAVSVSHATYRRWLKEPPSGEFPKEYRPNVAKGIYALLEGKQLSYESARVGRFIETNIPEYFQASIGRIAPDAGLFSENSTHQEKITTVLSSLGNSAAARSRVDKSSAAIQKFSGWGEAWKFRIGLLLKMTRSKEITLIDRLVAYGALFYLIIPFDLIPDAVPVFGYVDDFGILGFAAAYYITRFPALVAENKGDDGAPKKA